MNELLAKLRTQYGTSVPMSVLDNYFGDGRDAHVRRTYRYDPITSTISNRKTGNVITNDLLSAGSGRSPITRLRAVFFLTHPDAGDPWRVSAGRDGEGPWYKVEPTSEKTFV